MKRKTALNEALLALIAFTLVATTPVRAEPDHPLREFVSDGCTLFPEGTRQDPHLWADCCLEHDLKFWAGGTHAMRKRADLGLRECVREKGKVEIAEIMYLGVRAGSLSPFKFKRGAWGNSQPAKKHYHALTREDLDLIRADLPHYAIPREIEARFFESLERQD